MTSPVFINRLSAPVDQAAISPAHTQNPSRRGEKHTARPPQEKAVRADGGFLPLTPSAQIKLSPWLDGGSRRAVTLVLAIVLTLFAANTPALFAKAHANIDHDTQIERY